MPTTPSVLAGHPREAFLQALREAFAEDLTLGFYGEDAMVERLLEHVDDVGDEMWPFLDEENQEGSEVSDALSAEDLASLMAEVYATWESPWKARLETEGRESDYEKLRRVFEALESQGILAKMNFGYDGEEGWEEGLPLAKQNGHRGFVFFPREKASRILDEAWGGYLPLFHSAVNLTPGAKAAEVTREEDEAIAEVLVEALRAEGLPALRDRSLVATEVPAWYKPLPGREGA